MVWYRHILQFGRIQSLESSFAEYNPPYLYLMSLASLLDGRFPVAEVIKIATIPFHFILAVGTWYLCRSLDCDRLRSAVAAVLLPFLPEVALNTFAWGQCDVIHTSLVIVAFALLFRGHTYLSMISYGIALSFKLQRSS